MELGTVPQMLTAVAGLIVALLSAWNTWSLNRVKSDVKKVQHQTNAMHDAIVKSEKKESDAQGFKRGQETPNETK